MNVGLLRALRGVGEGAGPKGPVPFLTGSLEVWRDTEEEEV